MPVDELELQGADHVFTQAVFRLAAGKGTGVDGLEFGHAEQAFFHALQQLVLLHHRQVATGANQDLCAVRLDLGEEFHAVVELRVGHIDQADQAEHAEQGGGRAVQQSGEQAPVELPAGAAAFLALGRVATGDRAQHGHEDQGHGQ